jgi:hypothetical protein
VAALVAASMGTYWSAAASAQVTSPSTPVPTSAPASGQASGQSPPPAAPYASAKPEVEFDPSAAFPRYKTFDWVPDLQPLKNSTNHQLLVSAIERALTTKGLSKASPGRPADVLVNVYARAEGRLKGTTSEKSAATRDPSSQSVVTTFERERLGVLAIELIDGISRNMVWRAMATQMLGSHTETAERIDGHVATLLASYPPTAPKP